jgi:KDO2-lipid IV(A) lauroyltransferase
MSKHTRRELRRPVETAAFRVALAVIPRLPRWAVRIIANAGGRLGMRFDRLGRAVGLANLQIAFGSEKELKEQKAILRRCYITMVRTFLDVIWFGRKTEKRLSRYVTVDPCAQPFLCKNNQVCITAHYGNWELIGLAMAVKGVPLHSIAMPVKNSAVDRMLIERRQVTGQQIVPRAGALKKLLTVLRNKGKAGFLVDQNTSEREGGIWADFFGLPVPVTPAPAALAAKTGSEIFIGFCKPLPGGRYHIYITDRIAPPGDTKKETLQKLSQQILSAIEREVRSSPGHWLWTYKRWKTASATTNSDRWPFYCKNQKSKTDPAGD